MTSKTDNPVARDVAESEFERFAEAMTIDVNTAALDAEDLAAFNKQKSRVVTAIERGHLVINENGEAVFTPSNERTKNRDPLTFHERSGASLMALDGKKKGHDVAKTYSVMADMCRCHPNTFAGMVGADIKTCEALFALLMD